MSVYQFEMAAKLKKAFADWHTQQQREPLKWITPPSLKERDKQDDTPPEAA